MEAFSHAAPVLRVTQMNPSLKFYQDRLGFTVTFLWQDPPTYAVLKRGGVSIHLSLSTDFDPAVHKGAMVYVFVHHVEALYREFLEKGLEFRAPLSVQDYKMKDFDLADPDGNVLTFGQGED